MKNSRIESLEIATVAILELELIYWFFWSLFGSGSFLGPYFVSGVAGTVLFYLVLERRRILSDLKSLTRKLRRKTN